MAKIMYVRVSSEDQNLARQMEAAKKEGGIDRIFADKKSGKDFDREQYKKMKEYIREGDMVCFSSIDRMGRTYKGIKKEWEEITAMGVDIKVLDCPLLDTTRKISDIDGSLNNLLTTIILELLSYMAENERKLIKERQRQGIEIAKKEGKYKGRQRMKIDIKKFCELQDSVANKIITHEDAWQELGMKRSTYFRILKEEYIPEKGRFAKDSE